MKKGFMNFDTGRPQLAGLDALQTILQRVHTTMPDQALVTLENDGSQWWITRVMTKDIVGPIDLRGSKKVTSGRLLREVLDSLVPSEDHIRVRVRIELRMRGRAIYHFPPEILNKGILLRNAGN